KRFCAAATTATTRGAAARAHAGCAGPRVRRVSCRARESRGVSRGASWTVGTCASWLSRVRKRAVLERAPERIVKSKKRAPRAVACGRDLRLRLALARGAVPPVRAGQPPAARAPAEPVVQDRSRLNRGFSFDSFVTGKANQLARAAAIQVSENPGISYNPLFVYGGVGLGKTHLLQAIGNQLADQRPQARIRYSHAEQYVTDVVRAYQQKSFDDFK